MTKSITAIFILNFDFEIKKKKKIKLNYVRDVENTRISQEVKTDVKPDKPNNFESVFAHVFTR